jgi:hypothetical protein
MKHFPLILATFVLFAGPAFADVVFVDGQAINVLQNGPFLNVGGQTYTVSHIGSSLYIDSTGPSYVPNLTPEQAAAYLNSTAEGRAAAAKWDSHMKKLASGKSVLDIYNEDTDALNKKYGVPAPRATLVLTHPVKTWSTSSENSTAKKATRTAGTVKRCRRAGRTPANWCSL